MPDMKQLAPEERRGVARALAPAIGKLIEFGNYEGPFDAVVTVELTDKNGKRWTASVTACDLTSVLSCAEVPATGDSAMKLLLALCLAFAGCGGNYSSTPPPTPTNITGSWTVTATSTVFPGVVTTGTGQVVQTGTAIAATLILTGSPCSSSGAFSGTLVGTTLNASLDENGQSVAFTGTVAYSGSSASGTYTAAAGGCTNGDKGTWEPGNLDRKPQVITL